MHHAAAYAVAAATCLGIPLLCAAALGAFRRPRRPTRRTVALLCVAIAASLVAYVPADDKPGPGPGPHPPEPPVGIRPMLRLIRGVDAYFRFVDAILNPPTPSTPVITQ